MKIFPTLVFGCALLSTELVLAQVSTPFPGVSTPGPTPTPTPTPTPVRAIRRVPPKVVVPPKMEKKPDLKGIESGQALRFQSLKGTDLKDRPNFDPKGDEEGNAAPALQEGQLLRLGVGGTRHEANSDLTKVVPKGGQTNTFDLSKSLTASNLQDLLMSDSVKERAGRNIREDIGKAKDLSVDFGGRESVVGGSVSEVTGKSLGRSLDRGRVGSIGKYRKGMGLSRGITERVGNGRSRVMDATLFEYTDPDGKSWSILLVPKSELDADGKWRPEGEVQAHDGAIAVDDVLLEVLMAGGAGSDEAYDELVLIVQNGIDKNTTKDPPLAPLTSDGESGDDDGDDSFEWASWLGGSTDSGDSGDSADGGDAEGGTDELPPLAPLTSDEDSEDSTDGGDSGDSTDGDSFHWAWEDSDEDSEDSTNDDGDDDSGTSERGVLGDEQENGKGGPLNGKRFRGIVVGGFTGSGGGDTVRTGESSGRGGPLAKAPKSGNSGHPTVRIDPDDLREGMLNLGKIDSILAGKDGPIDFGEEGDPRTQPKPEGEAGTKGPTIVGGAPGVVTRNLEGGTQKFGGIQGEATKVGVGEIKKEATSGRVNVKKVEIKEGTQVKAK